MPSKFFVRGLNGQFGGSSGTSATTAKFSGVTMDAKTGALTFTGLSPAHAELAKEYNKTTTPDGLLDSVKTKIEPNRGADFLSYCTELISDAEKKFNKSEIEQANQHHDEVTKWVALQQSAKKTSENNYIVIDTKIKAATAITVTPGANTTAVKAITNFIGATAGTAYDDKSLKTATDKVFTAISTYTTALGAEKADYDGKIIAINEAWAKYVELVQPKPTGQFQKYSKTKYNSNCGRFMSELEGRMREVFSAASGNQMMLRQLYGISIGVPFMGFGQYGGGIINPFINNKMVGGADKYKFIYASLGDKVKEVWKRAKENFANLGLEKTLDSKIQTEYNTMQTEIDKAIKVLIEKENYVIGLTKEVGIIDALLRNKKLTEDGKKDIDTAFKDVDGKIKGDISDAVLIKAFQDRIESVVRKTGRCLNGMPTLFGALFRS